ncbi:MAG: aspartyl/asparaginyl beta-hydroxylase domain-containing protein [Caulobacterales bacterium]|nr:aspartyl/asparaginyl beta-hydroxylase domain-containing protein [Caulobacterales bacterium]
MTSAPDYPAIARQALAALRAGQAEQARDLFEQVTRAGHGDASVWVAQAYACRELGDGAAVLAAAEGALRLESGNARALLLKGDHFLAAGDRRSASSFYASAIRSAPAAAGADLKAELARASRELESLAGGFDQFLSERLPDPSPRFKQSVDLMTGKSRLYLQEPRFYYFPGLPQIQFAPREATPFLDRLEAAVDDVREELLAVMDNPELFTPYIETRENRPNSSQQGMLENSDWTGFYLIKDGQPVAANVARFPRTLAALEGAPLTDIPGRAPSVLFSRLVPGAHIPPHSGLVNTRLICHLPVICPDGCSFRVGSETRDWAYGQAWAFDDTINHEAWNRSDQERIVLIFDVWKPEITEAERAEIRALFAAVEAYGEGPATWDV